MSVLDANTMLDGRYRVIRSLGAGAMGAVVLALDPDGNEVAIKTVLDNAPDSLRAPQRFLREVKTLNRLEHPNVVQLLDFGRDERLKLSYMVMEVARGDDISKLTLMGRTPPELALLVARDVAAGLALAHDLGIVHRDLKPANVMLCPEPDGSVVAKVLDFGLAMLSDSDTRLTKTGTAPGTVNYMSPEQLLGQGADPRSDIYGLGIILFEMLAGRSPFKGQNQTEIALDVLNGTPPNLATTVPDVPVQLAALVTSMMARDRNNRPQSAVDLRQRVDAVSRALALPPVRVSHVGSAEKPRAAWNLRPAIR